MAIIYGRTSAGGPGADTFIFERSVGRGSGGCAEGGGGGGICVSQQLEMQLNGQVQLPPPFPSSRHSLSSFIHGSKAVWYEDIHRGTREINRCLYFTLRQHFTSFWPRFTLLNMLDEYRGITGRSVKQNKRPRKSQRSQKMWPTLKGIDEKERETQTSLKYSLLCVYV